MLSEHRSMCHGVYLLLNEWQGLDRRKSTPGVVKEGPSLGEEDLELSPKGKERTGRFSRHLSTGQWCSVLACGGEEPRAE